MPGKQQQKPETEEQRIKLSGRIPITAYEAISEIQRKHRRRTGKYLPRWKIVATAIIVYAQQQGITVGE